MQLVGRVVSSVSEFYKDLNPATLSGAIDVVVVDQGNGLLACSPFHVRFGKLKLLRPSEKVVEILINGELTNLKMKVGEAGEAFFVFETDSFVPSEYSTSPIQSPKSDLSESEPLDMDKLSLDIPALTHGSRVMDMPTLKSSPGAIDDKLISATSKDDNWSPEASITESKHESLMTTSAVTAHSTESQLDSSKKGETELSGSPEAPKSESQLSSLIKQVDPIDSDSLRGTASFASLPEFADPPSLKRPSLVEISENDQDNNPRRDSNASNSSNPQLFQSLTTQTPQIDDIITEAYGAKPVAKFAVASPTTESVELTQSPNNPSLSSSSPSRKYTFTTLRTWWNRGSPNPSASAKLSDDENATLRPGMVLGNDLAASSPDSSAPDPGIKLASSFDATASLPIHIRSRSHDGIGRGESERVGRPQAHSPLSERSVSPPHKDELSDSGDGNSHHFAKTLRLTADQLKSLNLKLGANKVLFSVSTKLQGKQSCEAMIYLYNVDTKIVISDIDGTITKSDALGHIFTMVGRDWTHLGVASLYTNIKRNGYEIMYLTSRAIGQASSTRDYLKKVEQGQYQLPQGPVIMSPDRLLRAFHREVIRRRPEEFKIACLKDIRSLFGDRNPFYAGFGNRITDAIAYRSVDVPPSRIFTIDPTGELKWQLLDQYSSSYIKLNDLVDQIFPAMQKALPSEYNDLNYWKQPLPQIDVSELYDDYEDEEYEDEYDDVENSEEEFDDQESGSGSLLSEDTDVVKSTSGSTASSAPLVKAVSEQASSVKV